MFAERPPKALPLLFEAELTAYRELIKKRLAGEPVAYLLGEHEFWGLPVYVDRDVLVPRPDTETVVEVARATRADRAAPCRVLDLCTGTGAIALALAKELPAATVIAADVSPEAVAIAARNAERNQLAARVEVRRGDLFAPVAGETFDLVTANPPYIATSVIPTLSAEVRKEPVLALDGGAQSPLFVEGGVGDTLDLSDDPDGRWQTGDTDGIHTLYIRRDRDGRRTATLAVRNGVAVSLK